MVCDHLSNFVRIKWESFQKHVSIERSILNAIRVILEVKMTDTAYYYYSFRFFSWDKQGGCEKGISRSEFGTQVPKWPVDRKWNVLVCMYSSLYEKIVFVLFLFFQIESKNLRPHFLHVCDKQRSWKEIFALNFFFFLCNGADNWFCY